MHKGMQATGVVVEARINLCCGVVVSSVSSQHRPCHGMRATMPLVKLLLLNVYSILDNSKLNYCNASTGSKSAADLASSFLNSVGQELQGSSSGEQAYYDSNGGLYSIGLFLESDSCITYCRPVRSWATGKVQQSRQR